MHLLLVLLKEVLHTFLSLFYQSRSKELIAFRAYSADTEKGHKRSIICTKCNETIQVWVRFVNSLLVLKNNKSNFKVEGVWSDSSSTIWAWFQILLLCPFQEYVSWLILMHISILELLFHCFKIFCSSCCCILCNKRKHIFRARICPLEVSIYSGKSCSLQRNGIWSSHNHMHLPINKFGLDCIKTYAQI